MDSTTRPDEDARSRPGPDSEPEAGRPLFDGLRAAGLQRPEEGWIGGVLAMLARRLRWDPALVRGLGVVAAVLFFSPMLLLYGLAWILLPDHRDRIPAQRAIRGDVTGGFVVGALLVVIGALNVVTPLNLAGPFAVLVNVVIIALVVWLVVATARGRRGRRGADAGSGSGSGSGSAGDEAGDDAGKDRAGRSSSVREDGRPAWYPKDAAPAAAPTAAPSASAAPGPPGDGGRADGFRGGATAPVPSAHSLREREVHRRRRRVTFGLLLLVVPGLVLLGLAADALGVPASAAVLTGLVPAVMLLAMWHIVAALRGRRGRGFLLVAATTAMLLAFAVHQGAADAPRSDAAHRAFSSTTTEEESLNAVFSSSTVDLRHLEGQEGTVEGVLNTAFASNDVIVPDGAAVVVQSRQALGSLTVEMQDEQRRIAGLDAGEHRFGPADAALEIRLTVQSAFGSTTVHDASSWAAEDPEAAPRPDREVTL